MSNKICVDPLFAAVDAPAFTDRHIAGLAAGTAAAVRVPGFLDTSACTQVLAALGRLPVGSYDADRVPTPIMRFGPALNDHQAAGGGLDQATYWAAADAARAAWAEARIRPDPIAVALARLGQAWGSAVTPATVGGRPVFGGTLREINQGALIHFDEVVREFPRGVFDQQIVAQLAFNLWVSAPVSGGETSIWRRRWQPGDEQYRDAYGYTPRVVDGCQHVRLRPAPGDALLFNPTNLHAVAPNAGERRIAFAFFIALTTTGNLIAWS